MGGGSPRGVIRTELERRVAVVFHEDVLGGATLSVLRILPVLEERGWSFRFWVDRPSRLYDELSSRGLQVEGAARGLAYSMQALRLPPGPRTRLAGAPPYLRAFRRFLEQSGAAVLHANSLLTLAEVIAARPAGLATVFHVHEMLPQTRKGRLAARLAGRFADEIVAVSRSSAAAFGDHPQPRIVYEAAAIPQRSLLREPGERTVVGSVAVISTRKGSDLFVEAARIVREQRDDIDFVMVGAPTDALELGWAEDLLAEAESIGIEHHMRADVPAMLAEWDIFALPSRRDPYPISMLEAMAAGLPVIGTAVDGLAEQIDAHSGLLVEPDSAGELAQAIIDLHLDPDRRAELGRGARQLAQAEFSIEQQAIGIEAAYLGALEARQGRRR